ncbi:hypothetical protein BGZ72_006941, partial [Mortierella alpina]
MGIHGLWPLIKQKGYEPTVLFRSTCASNLASPTSTIHVDLQACLFVAIKQAYSNHPPAIAHGILEGKLGQLVPKSNCVIYVDGLRCKQKAQTHAARDKDRTTSLNEAKEKITEFAGMVERREKATRQTFVGIKKSLGQAFVWSLEAKVSLVAFLQHSGWQAVLSRTEYDIEICRAFNKGDVVATIDSDLLIYASIETIWRPVSGGRFLQYRIVEVAASLHLTRPQLTALGIVSTNDYDKNIWSLGPSTNHGIVKTIEGSDPRTIVEKYLQMHKVMDKNEQGTTFANSLGVFVDLMQDPLDQEALGDQTPYMELREEYKRLHDQYTKDQKEMQEMRRSSENPSERRHKSNKTFNRYRPVGPPLPPVPSLPASGVPSEQRTRPQRPRYSFKTRRRHKHHDPPKYVKMYKWKPHVLKTSDNAAKATDESAASSTKAKKATKAK